jgi:hypothetical protein
MQQWEAAIAHPWPPLNLQASECRNCGRAHTLLCDQNSPTRCKHCKAEACIGVGSLPVRVLRTLGWTFGAAPRSQPLGGKQRQMALPSDDGWCPLLMWRMPQTSEEWNLLKAVSAANATDSETEDDEVPAHPSEAPRLAEKHAPARVSSCVRAQQGPARSPAGRWSRVEQQRRLRAGTSRDTGAVSEAPLGRSSGQARAEAALARADAIPHVGRQERIRRRRVADQRRAATHPAKLGPTGPALSEVQVASATASAGVAPHQARSLAPPVDDACRRHGNDADVDTLAMCLESFACIKPEC